MFNPKTIVVIGASGAIGGAFVEYYGKQYPDATLLCFARSNAHNSLSNQHHYTIDVSIESSIHDAAVIASGFDAIDLLIVATGTLHSEYYFPEKSLQALSMKAFEDVYKINTIGPALILKHFIPLLSKNTHSIAALLSARVGSISDNHLGGWYAYRASKAALNMVIKNASIEVARKNKYCAVIGLHPGTVNSPLSKPFQANVPHGKLFSAQDSVNHMANVIQHICAADSGKCFAYDGTIIEY